MKASFILIVAILVGLTLFGYLVSSGNQTASAMKTKNLCGGHTPIGGGAYYTMECCQFNTDDQDNIIGTPKCAKYVCNSSTQVCKTATRSSELSPELLNPPSAGTKGGQLGSTDGIQGGGGSLSTQGSETNQTLSNFTSSIPLSPPVLKVNPQQEERDNNINSSQ